MNVSLLESQGFITIPYPEELRGTVQMAMQSWKRFCHLPQNAKNRLSKPGSREKDWGYMRRKDHVKGDDKELLHLTRETLPELQQRADGITDSRATDFIHSVDALTEGITPIVRQLVHAVESKYQLPGVVHDAMENKGNWVFRFLHYKPGSDILAHAHADRGDLTLHLGESHEGGEYLNFNGCWKKWPVNDSQTIIFPSLGIQHRSRGVLRGLCHRVTPNEETIRDGRFAMVAFIDCQSAFQFGANGIRSQDLPEGFNYTMPFEEFDKLFTSEE